MLIHDLKLALQSFRRNKLLTALTIGAISAGIAAVVITMTLYHARSGHPIWWKEDKLFAVTMDTRGSDHKGEEGARHPEYPPFELTYRDARALYRSNIPTHSVMMYTTDRVLDPGLGGVKPFSVVARVTTADFFSMFDVPFLYGSGWKRSSDEAPEPVVVIGRRLNDKLFKGVNSVGRSVTLSGRQYRIVGILQTWMPAPRYYDLSGDAFRTAEDIFMPFGWGMTLQMATAGNIRCVTPDAKMESFNDILTADCVWLQYWVELPSAGRLREFRQFVDNYASEEKRHGRFPRPLNNRVVDIPTWFVMNNVIGDDSRMELALALLFLAVCIFNTLGLMLAKFLGTSHISGLRRALGASRGDIIRQHLTEVMVVGLLGGVVGTGLAWSGLWAIRVMTYIPTDDDFEKLALAQSLSHMDLEMLLVALLISVLTGVIAGLYPAWRIGRMAPAVFLKS